MRTAQRRPESELRRHPNLRTDKLISGQEPLNEGRSLNSGDTTPIPSGTSAATSAQRRPESELRRHTALRIRTLRSATRSTKAGV